MMPTLCCIGCNGLSLTLGGRDHTIVDDAGRSWSFEDHRYFGPIVLRKDGEPRAVQPGSQGFMSAAGTWASRSRAGRC